MNNPESLSALETYEVYGKGAPILKSKDAMSILLRLAQNLQIERSSIPEDSPAILLLMSAGFATLSEKSILLSKQGQRFLSLLGVKASSHDLTRLQTAELESVFQPLPELTELSNLELIQRCVVLPSDQVAWQEFVRRFDNFLRRTIEQLLRNSGYDTTDNFIDLFEDLIQSVYMELLKDRCKALLEFRGESDDSIFPYLQAITTNVIQRCLTNREKKEQDIDQSIDTAELMRAYDFLSFPLQARDQLKISEDEIHLWELREELDHLLDQVLYGKNKFRNLLIFKLSFYDGLSPEEIAEIRGLNFPPAHAIEQLLSSIRYKLREALKKQINLNDRLHTLTQVGADSGV